MLLGSVLTTSVLFWSAASAAPQTKYTNATTTAASITSSASFTAPSCALNCTYVPIWVSGAYWSKYVTAVTAAQVVVIINDSKNTTSTVTNYVQSLLLVNGTAPTNTIPPRTDTNAAGTVTQQITRLDGSIAVFTYPTPYYEIDSYYTWEGVVPYSRSGHTTCTSNDGAMPLPSHTPWPTPTGTVDPEDKFGWSYTFQDDWSLTPLSAEWVASEFPGQLIDTVFQSCTSARFPAPASAVQAVTYLTATSTAHVSDAPSSAPKASPSSHIAPSSSPIASSRSPIASSADTHVATPGPPPSSANIASRPDVPQSPGLLSKTPSAAITPSAKSPGTTPSTVSAANPKPSPKPVTEDASLPSLLPSSIAPASPGPFQISSEPAADLSSAAGLLSVPTMNEPPNVSGAPQGTQTVQTRPPFQISDAPVAVVTSGGKTYASAADSAPAYVLGTQTLVPGGPAITVAGTQISLAPNTIVTSGGKTSIAAPALVLGTGSEVQTKTAGVGGYIVSSLSGSMIATGSVVKPSHGPAQPSSTAPDSEPAYIVGTQTLVPGGPAITVAGTQISLAAGETALVLGTGSTVQTKTAGIGGYILTGLSGSAIATSEVAKPSTAASVTAPAYIIGSQTLIPGGPAITVSGTRISLAPGDAALVLGTGSAVQTRTAEIGGYISTGLGGSMPAPPSGSNAAPTSGPNTTSTSNVPVFRGAASYKSQVGLGVVQVWAALWWIWAGA